MKYAICLVLNLALFFSGYAQSYITGTVNDHETSLPLVGAHISLNDGQQLTVTDRLGQFTFDYSIDSAFTITANFIGYQKTKISFDYPNEDNLQISLRLQNFITEEVIISSIRASKNSAATLTNIDQSELSKRNLGQDLPELLKLTPSFVNTSDAGSGIGYTSFRIRGSDPTRINVTINGIPYNDSESQGLFLVDLPDFTSSVENLQIQRGVGTSTNGAGAFGASINIKTDDFENEPFAQTSHGFGSFNTRKHNLQLGSGPINERFNFSGRASLISSDGFIDRASSDLKSLFFSGGYNHGNHLIKATVFTGTERTYQAWNGVPEAFLDTNRTFNVYTYEDQVDQYQQDHYQLHYSSALHSNISTSLAFHYTKGKGYYEQYRKDDALASYGLNPVVIANDSILTSDIIRRRWLDNDFYGFTYALDLNTNTLENTIGGAWNRYEGGHYGEIIWAEFASNGTIGHRYYDNEAVKTDFNIFNKMNRQWTKTFNTYLDLQYRHVNYNFLGFDQEFQLSSQSESFNFFNPKVGANLQLNDQLRTYLSFAIANKEPNRSDFVDSSPTSRPTFETLYNAELGLDYSTKRTDLFTTFFYMHYTDQLVLTGALNDVGAYNRINTPASYRGGIEIQANHTFSKNVRVNGNIAYSLNKIKTYIEITDNFDIGTQEILQFDHSNIAFSPELVSGLQIQVTPIKDLNLSILSKYVGDQYLDNTSNEQRKLDAYFTADLGLNWKIKNSFSKNIELKLLVNNILDEQYESNGYTFGYISGGERIQENWYYPQAGTNFLIGFDVRF